MSLFNKVHLLLSLVVIEKVVYLIERNKTVLFRSNENAWNIDVLNHLFKINLLNVEIGFFLNDWFNVFVNHIEKEFRDVGFLLSYLQE